VRRDDSGKLILVGVYGTNILVAKFPATLALCLVLSVEAIKSTEFDIEIRVRIGDRTIAVGSGSISSNSPDWTLINIGRIIVPDLKEAGVLNFQVKIEEGQWMTICSHRVDLRAA
jgi:hypothetical protein